MNDFDFLCEATGVGKTLAHAALAGLGIGTLASPIDHVVDKVTEFSANKKKIQQILNKYDHFEAPETKNKYTAIIQLKITNVYSDTSYVKKVQHKGFILADDITDAKHQLYEIYKNQISEKNRKVDEILNQNTSKKDSDTDSGSDAPESMLSNLQKIKLLDIDVTESEERKWKVAYYTKEGEEGSEDITAGNTKESAVELFKQKFKDKGYKVILKGTYISEVNQMSLINKLSSLCEQADKVLKNQKSLNEDFDSYPPYLKRQILQNAKDNLASVATNPDVSTNLPMLYNPALEPKDEEEIALDSFVTLFQNTMLLIKLFYTGLGSVVPVSEKITNQDALKEIKELYDYLIVIPLREFDTVKSMQQVLKDRYRLPLLDWNAQVELMNTSQTNFNLGSNIAPLYDALISFYNYLKPLIQDIVVDSEFDFSDVELNLAKYLQTPFMDKNLGLDYIPDLGAYVTV